MKGDYFVHGVCYKEWAKKYKIQTDPEKCSNCGAKVYFTRPFFIKGYRGLMTETCKNCDSDRIMCRAVPVGEKLKLWNDMGRAFGVPEKFLEDD